MKKHGLFWMLMSFMKLSIQEEGQDKSTAGADDIGDFEVGGAHEDQTQSQSSTTETKSETVSVPKEQWERVTKTVEDVEREKYFNDSMSQIKKEIPDFDHTKVVDKLKEIHAKDPALAAQYNTPVGFKLLHKEIQEQAAQNDPVNGGSFKGGSGDFASVLKGAEEGKDGMRRRAIDMSL